MNDPKPDLSGGHFAQALQAGRFVITAEISPPLSCVRGDLVAKIRPLKGIADAVNVTDGASARAHMSALAAAAIMVEEGVEPILQFTCRDRNRIALQSDLLGAVTLGVRNFLMLRGDDPSKGDQPDAKPVFDLETRDLIALAAGLRDKGEIPPGRKVGAVPALTIGAADLPVEPAPGWSPDALRAKIDAGAQFVQTQFCMDAGLARRYVRRLAEDGITEETENPDRDRAVAVCALGALDQGQSVWFGHPRRCDRAPRQREGSGRGGRAHLPGIAGAAVENRRRHRRAHHGAGS